MIESVILIHERYIIRVLLGCSNYDYKGTTSTSLTPISGVEMVSETRKKFTYSLSPRQRDSLSPGLTQVP